MKTSIYFITCLTILFSCSCFENKIEKENTKATKYIAKKDVIKLNWLAPWYGEGQKEKLMREIAREFEFLNQDISLKIDFPQKVFGEGFWFTQVEQNLWEMYQKDEWKYDLMICERNMMRSLSLKSNDPFWSKNNLVDFSQDDWFIQAHKDGIITEEFKGTFGGIIPGPLLESSVNILFVSNEIEKKLGLKVKRHDMEFSDFLTYAEAVYKYNLSHNDKITFFSTQFQPAFIMLFQQLVLSEYGKTTFSSKQDTYNALSKLYPELEKLAAFKPLEQYTFYTNINIYEAQYILNHDKYLFNLQPSWIVPLWMSSNSQGAKKMKPCEIPSLEGRKALSYPGNFTSLFAVPKNSKNIEAVKRLVRFMTTAEQGEKWIKYSKNPTGLKTRIVTTDFGTEEYDIFYRHIQNKFGVSLIEADLFYTFFGTPASGYKFDMSAFNNSFHATDIVLGKITAGEALNLLK